MDEARAIAAITEFGYTPSGDGEYVKIKAGILREKWALADGGFLRFTREDGQWAAVPFSIAPEWEGIGGLDHKSKPQCYEWLYPFAYVANIYEVANAERAANAAG